MLINKTVTSKKLISEKNYDEKWKQNYFSHFQFFFRRSRYFFQIFPFWVALASYFGSFHFILT